MTLFVQACVVNTHAEAKRLCDRIQNSQPDLEPVIGQRFTDGMYTISIKVYNIKDLELDKTINDIGRMY